MLLNNNIGPGNTKMYNNSSPAVTIKISLRSRSVQTMFKVRADRFIYNIQPRNLTTKFTSPPRISRLKFKLTYIKSIN